MRWFWQRRKKDPGPSAAESGAVRERASSATAPRPPARSIPLASGAEPRDALLAFARDLLNAQGARVRVEEDDLVIATFAGAPAARYTTTIARARAEEDTALLTPGAPALDALFDEAAQRARITVARLSRSTDPAATALACVNMEADACGRCAGGHERWLAGVASCDACPLRRSGIALRWDSRPVSAEVTGWTETAVIEMTYRISGRDRRGRRDEWVRLAFDAASGTRVAPLSLDQIAATEQATPAAGADSGAAASGVHWAHVTLRPGMDALATYLAQRAGAEYQARAADVSSTHERLKRERPDESQVIAAALDRELASLADVYGIDVEANLEAICFITSPSATVSVTTAGGGALTLRVDAGRGAVAPPACAACAKPAEAGRVCAQGHAVCASCAEICAGCGSLRCPSCEVKPFARCSLCRELACPVCVRACDACGGLHCSNHVWACVKGDQSLCLRDVTLCDFCQAPLCATHASACSSCGVALCPTHALACKSGGEILCAAHAAPCSVCSSPLCAAHAQHCEECWKAVCRDDTFTCLGCGRGLCACASPAPCGSCGASYCARCRDGGSACPACRALEPASETSLGPLRAAAARDAAINLKRPWLTGKNALARVYVGRGLGRDEVYIVTEQGETLASRRKGWRA